MADIIRAAASGAEMFFAPPPQTLFSNTPLLPNIYCTVEKKVPFLFVVGDYAKNLMTDIMRAAAVPAKVLHHEEVFSTKFSSLKFIHHAHTGCHKYSVQLDIGKFIKHFV